MKLTRSIVVGACAVAAFAVSSPLAFADAGGQARRARGGAPTRVVGGVPRMPRALPIARAGGPTVHLYQPRRLGFDVHAGWAPGFAQRGFGSYGNGPFGYGYGYPGAAYPMVLPAYGSVRITDAPRDAEVYVDGYYAGVVDDFDGRFQRLNLEPGPHQIEVRTAAAESRSFDVSVQPGRTVTFRATSQRRPDG